MTFFEELSALLKEKGVMSTREIYSCFPDMNSKTVSWHIHKALIRGSLIQTSHGNYCLSDYQSQYSDRIEKLPQLSRNAFKILKESEYNFYLSGLDSLNGLVFEVNGNYPVIVCTEESRVKDVQLLLMRESDFAITEEDYAILDNPQLKSKIQYVVLSTKSFELSKDYLAVPEKAFVDLYKAVTRLDYPLPISEFPHILKIISPNPFKFKMSTKDAKLSDELNFLLSYDKNFIIEFGKYLN